MSADATFTNEEEGLLLNYLHASWPYGRWTGRLCCWIEIAHLLTFNAARRLINLSGRVYVGKEVMEYYMFTLRPKLWERMLHKLPLKVLATYR
jgi:hypothetical protein